MPNDVEETPGTIIAYNTHEDTKEKFALTAEVGATLAEMVEKWGEAVVYSHAKNNMKTFLRNSGYQASHRTKAQEEKNESLPSVAEIQAAHVGWQPEEVGSRRSADPVGAVLKAVGDDGDKIAAIIAALQAKLNA